VGRADKGRAIRFQVSLYNEELSDIRSKGAYRGGYINPDPNYSFSIITVREDIVNKIRSSIMRG
jgi:hypothetical protein